MSGIDFGDRLDEILGGRIHRLAAGDNDVYPVVREELLQSFTGSCGDDAVFFFLSGDGFLFDNGRIQFILDVFDLHFGKGTIALT